MEHRDRVKQTPVRPAFFGLFVIITGIALFVAGIGLGVSFAQFGPYLQDVGMLVTLLGCVLAIFGWGMVRTCAFPIAYLLCALPWPPYVHDLVTVPLQHLAATASVHLLQLTGMNVEQAGNTMHILSAAGVDRVLNVAEACAGMRSLLTFVAIGLAVAFLSARPLWQKLIISLSAVPVAIACNVFRIAGEALLDQHVSHAVSEGFAHSAVGLVLLVPGFGMFLLVGWALDRLSSRRNAKGKPSAAAKARVEPKTEPATSMPRPRGIAPRAMYVAVVVLLVASATTLTAASRVLHLHFVKIPVPLTQPLTKLPADLGPWHESGGNRGLSADVKESLGTNQFLFREYIDGRVAGEQAVESVRHDPARAEALEQEVDAAHPGSVVRLAVTYYTGRVDAVIHQSERCNVAGGIATAVVSQPQTWDVGGRPLDVRVVHLLHGNDGSAAPEANGLHYVAYCYYVNGRRESEAWRVRGELMNLLQQYAWYAKVEVTTTLADPAASQRVLSDFLSHALPEIEKCLPPMQSGAGTVTTGNNATPTKASPAEERGGAK
jgi:exosortase